MLGAQMDLDFLAANLETYVNHGYGLHETLAYLDSKYSEDFAGRRKCMALFCKVYLLAAPRNSEFIESLIQNNWLWMLHALLDIDLIAKRDLYPTSYQDLQENILLAVARKSDCLTLDEFKQIFDMTDPVVVQMADNCYEGLLFIITQQRARIYLNVQPDTIDPILQFLQTRLFGVVKALYKCAQHGLFNAFLLLFNLALRNNILLDEEDLFACFLVNRAARYSKQKPENLSVLAISDFLCEYLYALDKQQRRSANAKPITPTEFLANFIKRNILRHLRITTVYIPRKLTYLFFELDDLSFLQQDVHKFYLDEHSMHVDTSQLMRCLHSAGYDFASARSLTMIRHLIRNNNPGIYALYKLGVFTDVLLLDMLGDYPATEFLYLFEMLSKCDASLLGRITDARLWQEPNVIREIVTRNYANLLKYVLDKFPKYFTEAATLQELREAKYANASGTWQVLYQYLQSNQHLLNEVSIDDPIKDVINYNRPWLCDPLQQRKVDLHLVYKLIAGTSSWQASKSRTNIAFAIGYLPKDQNTLHFLAAVLSRSRNKMVFAQAARLNFKKSLEVLVFVFRQLKILLTSSARRNFVLPYLDYSANPDGTPIATHLRINRTALKEIITLDDIWEVFHQQYHKASALQQLILHQNVSMVHAVCKLKANPGLILGATNLLEIAILNLATATNPLQRSNLFETIYILIASGASIAQDIPQYAMLVRQVKFLMLVIHFDLNVNRHKNDLGRLPEVCMDKIREFCGPMYARPRDGSDLSPIERATLLKFAKNPNRLNLEYLVLGKESVQYCSKRPKRSTQRTDLRHSKRFLLDA